MSNKLHEFLSKELRNLEAAGLYQEGLHLKSAQGARIQIGNKTVLNFVSENYLGWAKDARLVKASEENIREFGTGWASGRIASGTHASHKLLEKTLSEFLNTESSVLFPNAYLAHLGICESLFLEQDYLFCDFSLSPSM